MGNVRTANQSEITLTCQWKMFSKLELRNDKLHLECHYMVFFKNNMQISEGVKAEKKETHHCFVYSTALTSQPVAVAWRLSMIIFIGCR